MENRKYSTKWAEEKRLKCKLCLRKSVFGFCKRHCPRATMTTTRYKIIQPGVVEFHCAANKDLMEDFYKTVDSLKGFTVDVWIMDIVSVLEKYGYRVQITKEIK